MNRPDGPPPLGSRPPPDHHVHVSRAGANLGFFLPPPVSAASERVLQTGSFPRCLPEMSH